MASFIGTMLLAAFRGTLVGVGSVAMFITAGFITGDSATLTVFLVLSFLFSVAGTLIHELGHAIAAWSVGWRVHQIVVGHVGYAPKTGKWSLERRGPETRDYGGWVSTTPGPRVVNRSGELAVHLGGCLANLVSAAACLIFSELISSDANAQAIARGFAAVSIVVALANLDPWRDPSTLRSDGRAVVEALARRRRPPDPIADAEARVLAFIMDGLKPEPADLDVLRAILIEKAVQGIHGAILKSAAINSGDLAWLTRLILESERQGEVLVANDFTALALSFAVVDGDGAAGQAWLDRVPEGDRTDPSWFRALAAVEHVKGRSAEATAAIASLRTLVNNADWGDDDDRALFHAIETGAPLPKLAASSPPASGA